MRVVLFFDGKNFYSGLKDQAPNTIIDFNKMAKWLVQRVEGTHLWGAYYYTGIEPGVTRSEGQNKLAGFLDMLELQPGFFVKRFPRKQHVLLCGNCGAENRLNIEKEIDTTMVADMLRLAAVDAFDTLVLLSGDQDLTPAVDGVRALGKQAYVATWGRAGLSTRLRRTAFDHIDLLEGIPSFTREPLPNGVDSAYPPRPGGYDDMDDDYEDDNPELASGPQAEEIMLEELSKAQQAFGNGYVGMNYFIKRWQSDRMHRDPEVRRLLMEKLIADERVILYEAPDGNKAIRLA